MKRIAILAAVLASAACLFSCKGRHHEAPEEAVQADSVLTAHAWTPVDPMELNMNPVENFAQDWMALAMGNSKKYNSMTISWGTIGELWNKPVVIVFVSSDRASKQMMDDNAYFTVTGFPRTKACKDALVYIGSHSLRDDPDKTAHAGMTVEFTEAGNPIFAEGRLAIECRKMYSAPFDLNRVPDDIRERMYAEMGVHTMYIGEITGAWEKK